MTVVGRRALIQTRIVDDDYVLLHLVGGLIVDPRRCPQRIHTASHWQRTDTIDPLSGANAECACTLEAVS